MSAHVSVGGVLVNRPAADTQVPIFVRVGGDDNLDGSDLANAVATPERGLELIQANGDNFRQYLELTGFIGTLSGKFTAPTQGNRGAIDFGRTGAFDNGKTDAFNFPFAFYADPTVVEAITVLSYSVPDARTGLQVVNISETLIVNAHINQFFNIGAGGYAAIKSNTANAIVIARTDLSATGAGQILKPSCELDIDAEFHLNCPVDVNFQNIRFHGIWAPFLRVARVANFTNCVFDTGLFYEGPGQAVNLISCQVNSFLFGENIATISVYCNFLDVNFAVHGVGAAGKNQLKESIIDDCHAYGLGNPESTIDLEIHNCHFLNAKSNAIHKQSPVSANVKNCTIDDSGNHGIAIDTQGGKTLIRDVGGTGSAGYGLVMLNGSQANADGPNVDVTGASGDVLLGDRVVAWATFDALAAGQSLNDLLETYPQFCRLFK